MKPVWIQTLVWVVAVVAALLLALSGPDILQLSPLHHAVPQGAAAPR